MDDYGYEDQEDYEELGLTVSEGRESLPDSSEDSMADAFFAAQELDNIEAGPTASSLSSLAIPLQLARIDTQEEPTKLAIKKALSGELPGATLGIDSTTWGAAVEEFTEVTGENPANFAKRISIAEGTEMPRSSERLRTAAAVLRKSGEYMDIGPGGRMIGQSLDEANNANTNQDLQVAFSNIGELAEGYFTDAAKKGNLYGQRKEQLEGELTSWILDKDRAWSDDSFLPLPNQLNTEGLIPTRGAVWRKGKGMLGNTTPYTPLEHAAKIEEMKLSGGTVPIERQADLIARRPSLQNTMTMYNPNLENPKLTQSHEFALLRDKVESTRNTLRGFSLSTRDEYRGNTERVQGLDNVDDEQAARLQFIDHSLQLDIDSFKDLTPGADSSLQDDFISNAMSQYGELTQGRSALSPDAAVKKILNQDDPNSVEVLSRGTYSNPLIGPQPHLQNKPVQGSKEWLAQRIGKVTGSKTKTLKKGAGDLRMAIELAKENLGISEDEANAYTARGNKMEDRVKRAFMANEGRGLTLKEAYFEESKSLPGFGASPDGRLYNSDGSSAGLLELKYFGESTFGEAKKNTEWQMQLQMMVGEEEQTHFYAINADTGESQHHLVKADPKVQKEIRELGESALANAKGLDLRGIQKMERAVKNVRKGSKAEERLKGQTTSFVGPVEEEEAGMVAFDPTGLASPTEAVQEVEDNSKPSRKLREAKMLEDSNTLQLEATSERERLQAQATKEIKESVSKEDSIVPEKYYDQAKKDSAKAANEATKELKAFGQATREAAGTLKELGELVTGGNKTAMDEIAFAAAQGMDTESVRGMRKNMELGGLLEPQLNASINAYGDMAHKFQAYETAAPEIVRLNQTLGNSKIPGISTSLLPSIEKMDTMNAQDWGAHWLGIQKDLTPQGRKFIDEMVGSQAASYRGDVKGFGTAWDEDFNVDGTYDQRKGQAGMEQEFRDLREGLGSVGEGLGMASALSIGVGGVLATSGVKYIGKRVLKGRSPVDTLKKLNNVRGAPIVSKAISAGKLATPAGAALIGARVLGGVEDDGGAADTALDMLDFAAMGATAGTFIAPGIGTAVGAGVGLVAGGAWEAYQALTGDDSGMPSSAIGGAIPDSSIGAIPGTVSSSTKVDNSVVNVTVSNEISPDLIKTTTNVNGDLTVDEEVGLSTGDK